MLRCPTGRGLFVLLRRAAAEVLLLVLLLLLLLAGIPSVGSDWLLVCAWRTDLPPGRAYATQHGLSVLLRRAAAEVLPLVLLVLVLVVVVLLLLLLMGGNPVRGIGLTARLGSED